MKFLIEDLEWLTDIRELEELKPNGLATYYTREVDPKSDFNGVFEKFQIINEGNMYKGELCILTIGNLKDGRIGIRMININALPNGQVLERVMFDCSNYYKQFGELKSVFRILELGEIIKTGVINDNMIKRAQVFSEPE